MDDTERIIRHFVMYKTNMDVDNNATIEKEVEILIRLSMEIEDRYNMDCLITSSDMNEEHLYNINKVLISDNKMNWGRIITMFVLATKIAKHHGNNKEKIENIIDVLNSCSSQWIKTSGGGWNTFIMQFDNTKGLFKRLFSDMLYYSCKIINVLIML